MGITQVGSGETEGFEEGLDSEYHDAAEDPNVLEPEENTREAVLLTGVAVVHHLVNALNC